MEDGYESFLRPMQKNSPHIRFSKKNSGSHGDNLHGSFGPAETGSNYLGFSDNFALDEEVDQNYQNDDDINRGEDPSTGHFMALYKNQSDLR